MPATPITMVRTIELAKANGVSVGAHPGLPDVVGFGRRRIDVSPDETYAIFCYQIGALQALLRTRGMALHHVKSHGAYYAILNEDRAQAEAVIQAVIDTCDAPMLYYPAPMRTHLLTQVALDRGVDVVQEIYFDPALRPPRQPRPSSGRRTRAQTLRRRAAASPTISTAASLSRSRASAST